MSESIIRSIVRVALGHIKAGKFTFENFGITFTIEKLEKTQHTYAVMAETPEPFCVAHITA